MRDAIPFVDHFDNVQSSQLAGIERLAAGGGIKRRAIEINAFLVRTRVDYASPEFGEIAVVIIEPLRHCTAKSAGSLEMLFSRINDMVVLPLAMPGGMVTLI